eukprot:m.146474 g.146474  ORF g.146474 m.146474 type:complete len:534 (+) comp24313_c0_seq2:223-1824(+)
MAKSRAALLDDDDEDEEVVWQAQPKPHSAKSLSSNQRRLFVTVVMCFAFFALGLVVAMLGPTLLDLGHLTNSTVQVMAFVFTARSFGYLTGSVVGGQLFDRTSTPCLHLATSMLLTAFGTFFVPLCSSVVIMGFLVSLQGLSMGFLDTGGNVLLLSMWGTDVGPYMQTLHFSFGVGAFVSPLLAKPFISEDLPISSSSCSQGNNMTTMTTTTTPLSLATMTSNATTTMSPEISYHSNVRFAFWIASFVFVPLFFAFLYLHKTMPKTGEKNVREDVSDHTAYRRQGTYRNVILGMTAVFELLYVGLEVSFGGYIFSYVVKYCPLQLTEAKGAYITSVFWGAFTLGRMSAIGCSLIITPGLLTSIDLGGCVLSAIFMFAMHESENVIWWGSAIFGFCMGPIFPSTMHLIEGFIEVTGRAASILVVGAATGEMILPLLTGTLFEHKGPVSFLAVNLTGICIANALFLLMLVYGLRGKAQHRLKLARRALRSTEEDGEETQQGLGDFVCDGLVKKNFEPDILVPSLDTLLHFSGPFL